MPSDSEGSFIEDLYNATAWLSYYDAITEGIWILSVSKLAVSRFSKALNALEELFGGKA